jgi:N-acetylglucosaminyldiphosphoundecaprenol N-acetyl-beta-D-mannosaminyltransferase
VVDADSVADRDLLRGLEAHLRDGTDAVQARYLVLQDAGPSSAGPVSVGFLLFNQVRQAGRAALGWPASLVGNGMLFSRELLQRRPWNAFTGAEDLEYTLNLCLEGVRPAYAASATVRGPMAKAGRSSRTQRLRWEGGRFHQVRRHLGGVLLAGLIARDPAMLSVAIDLATPPLGVIALLAAAGAAVATGLALAGVVPYWAASTWLLALGLLAAHVLVGLLAGRASRSAYFALLRAPLFLASKLLVYLRLLAGFDAQRWERTERPGAAAAQPGRVEVAGVAIDPVTRQGAVERIRSALGTRELFQVATINLDFLVRAQVDPEVREIFRRTGLNVADGAPVVWLGRLLEGGIRERVAGADLVPDVCEVAAAEGASVFLLGGEEGAAAAAAAVLTRRYPNLQVAGWLEPPRQPLAEMDLEGMAARINESGADILFVAFGHPKQEKWIDLNRERLKVSVAMGVGCAFDVLAGRRRRAPVWMQQAGLEWLFRAAQEPGRLAGRYAVDATWLLRLTTATLLRRIA